MRTFEREELSLKKNYIYSFISQVLTLIIPIVTTPYLSRVLHEDGNGQYSFSFSIVTYFILFANLGFNIYGQREISKVRNSIEEKSRIFWGVVSARLLTTLISSFFLYLLLFTFGFGKYNKIIFMLSIQVIAVAFDINFYYQGIENFRAIAVRTILLKTLTLILIFIFVRSPNDTWIYALALSVSTLVSNLIMWPNVLHTIKFEPISLLQISCHFRGSFLIFLPTLAVTIYSVFDKTMIGLLSSNPDYENGCYEQAYKINSIALILVTIISSIFASRNSYSYSHGKMDDLRSNLNFAIHYVWLLSTPLFFGFVVLSSNLCSWFLGDGYKEVPLLLQIMSIRFFMSGFSEIFGSQLFIAIGKEAYCTFASFVAAIVNLVMNYFLIPQYGAAGAAFATIVCESIITIILAYIAQKNDCISLRKILYYGKNYLLSGAIMFFVVSLLQSFFSYSIGSFIFITLSGAVVYFYSLFVLKDTYWKNICNKILLRK